MPKIALIMPWRPGDPARQASCDFLKHYYFDMLSPDEFFLADDPNPTFNRGRALNAGVRRSGADIFVLADSDTMVSAEAMHGAIADVADGSHGCAIPFSTIKGLAQHSSAAVMSGERDPWGVWADGEVEWSHDAASAGGINILTRQSWEACGGFDERFAVWGFEDGAFEQAVLTLSGPISRQDSPAMHLWHPWDSTRGTPQVYEGRALCVRYIEAYADPEAMTALINEPGAHP